MRLILCSLLVFGSLSVVKSQAFKGEASIPEVDSDGFYRISLSPELSPYLNADFTNIRIYDTQNREVPYLFQEKLPVYYSQSFKPYEIVEKKQLKKCCTSLILRNPDGRPINNITLLIKNAEVTKEASLLGSDDKENWFALKQHFTITSIENPDKTSEIKIVNFPLSNYSYYQLQIEDSTTSPINILSAGYYEASSENGKYTELSHIHIATSDSLREKKTYISITFDTTQIVDKLSIQLTGMTYFLRKASLYTKEERQTKKGKKEIYLRLQNNFEFSSKQHSVIELPAVKVNEFLIIVENEDNPSLKVASLKAYQLNRFLTALLKKGEQYQIKIGANNLTAPSYDLGYFKDNIPDQTKILSCGPIVIYKEEGKTTADTFFTSRSIIWLAIVLVILILGFLSMRLIKETNAEKNHKL